MPKQTAVDVFVELHLMSALLEINASDIPTREEILQAYDVTEEEFEATLRYYAERPSKYKVLYEEVLNTLQMEYTPDRIDRGEAAVEERR